MMLGISCQVIHGIDQYETDQTTGTAATQSTGTGGMTGTSTTTSTGGSGTGTGGQGGGPPPMPCMGSEPGVCLPTFEAPWTGYFALHSTDLGMGPMTCPDTTVPPRFYQPTADPVDCTPCMCNGASTTCQGTVVAWEDTTCSAGNFSNYSVMETCTVTGANANGIQAMAATTTMVSCPPTGGTPMPVAVWGAEHSLCNVAELPVGECPSGEVCVEDANLKTCIKADGDVAMCPPGWEQATRYQYYDIAGATDNRGCNSCGCTPSMTNVCGGGTYDIFENATCSGGPTASLPEGASCANAVNSLSVRYTVTPGATSCTPTGGEPNGEIDPGPVAATLCCRN